MEEKKKKTTKKSTVSKTVKKTPKKEVVKEEVKKTPKKKVIKKTTKKKVAEKIDVPIIEKESKKKVIKPKDDEILEKTYIFNKKEKENIEQVINELDKDKIFLEDKVVERSPVNKGLILFLVFAIVLVVIGCTIYAFYSSDDEKDVEYYSNELYKSISIDDADMGSEDDTEKVEMKDIDYSNIINTTISDFEVRLVEGKDMIVLISSSTCYYCITFEPVLNEVLAAKKDTAIRLNITNMTTEETRRLRKYYAFTSAPTLLVIRNGIVKADTSGYMDKKDFTAWYEENVK